MRCRSPRSSGSRGADGGPRPGCVATQAPLPLTVPAGTIVAVSASSSWVHNKGSTSRLVALIKRNNDARRKSITIAGSLGWEFRMNQVLEPSDECPHCRLPLEILSVKVGLRGTAMVYACMNCAMARTENPKQQVLSASFRRAPGDRGKVRSAFFYS